MNIYTIPVVGVIGEDFTYNDLLLHLNKAKQADIIKLAIDSVGGYVNEGLRMNEAIIATKKPILATNLGDVASIAVSVFLSASKENRTFDPTKGKFLIHCPMVSPTDRDTYTAEQLTTVASELKKSENVLVNQYNEATGVDKEVLKGFMDSNIPLTSDQIEGLGFAKIVTPTQLQAVALYKFNDNNKKMDEKLDGFLVKLEAKFNAFTAKWSKAKALMLNDVNNLELNFEVDDPSQIAAGTVVTVAGNKPIDGDYVIPAIGSVRIMDGVVESVTPENGDDQVEALTKELAEAKAELEALKATNLAAKAEYEKNTLEITAQMESVKKDVATFKAQMSGGKPDGKTTPAMRATGKIDKKTFEEIFK